MVKAGTNGALKAHLFWWMREAADTRVHGTTGEGPRARFARAEAAALRPLNDRPPFRELRELTRRVQNDACVDIDTNHYTVPWRLIGTEVTVQVGAGQIRIHHAGAAQLPATSCASAAANALSIVPTCTASGHDVQTQPNAAAAVTLPGIELLRPLAEYEQAAGGSW